MLERQGLAIGLKVPSPSPGSAASTPDHPICAIVHPWNHARFDAPYPIFFNAERQASVVELGVGDHQVIVNTMVILATAINTLRMQP